MTADAPTRDTIRVLIVDDSTMVRQLLKAIVQSDPGMEAVGLAKNGREGIAKAAKQRPDVCLLDLEMPVMGGLEALPLLRSVADTEVVVVSSIAQAGSEERRTCLSLGAAAVVAKPSGAVSLDLAEVRGAELLSAIRSAVALKGRGDGAVPE